MDWTLAIGALCVGTVVGLTGMGGGALMTPMLVLFFGVSPLAAVSSDLVASAVMKPVGSAVPAAQLDHVAAEAPDRGAGGAARRP